MHNPNTSKRLLLPVPALPAAETCCFASLHAQKLAAKLRSTLVFVSSSGYSTQLYSHGRVPPDTAGLRSTSRAWLLVAQVEQPTSPQLQTRAACCVG